MSRLRGGWSMRAVVMACGTAVALASAAPAFAEPTPEDRAAAEALFLEGRKLAEKKELVAACDRFAKSQMLDPQVGTLLYLATCHEQTKQTATAWIEFKEALAQAEAAKKPDRIQQAQEGITRVEAILSRATIVVESPAPGQKVKVNGREVTVFDAALPYNPGTLAVEADAPEHEPHSQSVELPDGPATLAITIPKLVPKEKAKPPPPPPPKERDHSLAFVVGGAGLGVAALGFAFGGAAWATRDSADESCEGTFCLQEGLDGHDRAEAFAWTSNVLIGVGALGFGAGVALLFLWPPDEPAKSAGRPTLVAGRGSLVGGWTFALP